MGACFLTKSLRATEPARASPGLGRTRVALEARCHRLVASSMLRVRGSRSLELRMLLERLDSACTKPRHQAGMPRHLVQDKIYFIVGRALTEQSSDHMKCHGQSCPTLTLQPFTELPSRIMHRAD